MSRPSLTERTAAIAAQARSAADARGTENTAEPAEQDGSALPARAWWTVYRWGGEQPLTVFVHPPLTQPQVREHFYPTASGVIPFRA